MLEWDYGSIWYCFGLVKIYAVRYGLATKILYAMAVMVIWYSMVGEYG